MNILVIDDERSIRKTLKLRLEQWGHEVFEAEDGASGMRFLSEMECQVVITDLRMPGLKGEEVLHLVRREHRDTEVVVITGFASVESAVELMKAGAYDFLIKPLNFDHLRVVLNKIAEQRSLLHENRLLKDRVGTLTEEVEQHYRLDNLVGKSKPMQAVYRLINAVAPQESTVTICGETGTGKELVARAIHYNSPRKTFPMVTVDCGALSETLLESELFGYDKGAFTGANQTKRGRFEQAHGGTIFLDEVANASLSVQKRLLRVIQEKTFQRLGGEATLQADVRVIAAANQDLSKLVKEKGLREDLYYRLSVVVIQLPPLRERKDDIPLLARHFLDMYASRMGRERVEISVDAMKQLTRHLWPGNVREMSNVMERTLIMTPDRTIRQFELQEDEEAGKLPDSGPVRLDPPLSAQMEALERAYLSLALEVHQGRVKKISEQSGLNLRTLYRKMRAYGLGKKYFR
ncbi:MAG: sigma-54 dependent transcriptional regulator [Geobacteraceae bacterium]